MQQLRVHGPDDVRLDEVAEPKPGPRDAVLRVAACGICGSDLRYVRLGGLAGPMPEPMPLGHELSGVIDAVGAEVANLAPGDRVVLNPTAAGNMIGNGGREGGFTPLLLVREAAAGASLFTIPDGLGDDVAALTEPLGVGMNAVNQSEAAAGDKVVVFGAGPIGLAAITTLADRGIDDVIAVDLSPRRLEIASVLGARDTVDATEGDPWARIRALHGEEPLMGAPMAGSDVYIEASGAAPVIPQVLQHAKARARLSVVALHSDAIPVNFLLVMMKQLTIRGAMEYPDDYTDAIDLLARRDLSPMISHRYPLGRFEEALAVAQDSRAGGKVMIEMA
jgi:(R,R)-butanediol dehydrogenase/meso-butanediol dehydrogenase/diacetyl reductase